MWTRIVHAMIDIAHGMVELLLILVVLMTVLEYRR